MSIRNGTEKETRSCSVCLRQGNQSEIHDVNGAYFCEACCSCGFYTIESQIERFRSNHPDLYRLAILMREGKYV